MQDVTIAGHLTPHSFHPCL